jgi:hypothetical protein
MYYYMLLRPSELQDPTPKLSTQSAGEPPNRVKITLACTNIIENMTGTIRQVTRNVKRWRDASCAGPLLV